MQYLLESKILFRHGIVASIFLFVASVMPTYVDMKVYSDEIINTTPTAEHSKIRTLPDFKVELVYEVPLTSQGSWVSLTADDRGRLIASDQRGRLWRVTPEPTGSRNVPMVELIDVEIGFAQGLLYINDALYVMANVSKKDIKDHKEGAQSSGIGFVPPQSGVYRIRDMDKDDKFDLVEQLAVISGGDEHGPHGIVLGPDKKSIYLVSGNYTKIPQGITSRVPYAWNEDQLTPSLLDPRGHASKIKAPGGWLARFDLNGENWELLAVGMRNMYDIAINASGDVFGFDADMEWDLGTPWYRPTRVMHLVSGADFGWRSGSGKWPDYFEDSLPALKNIGPGSPTGMLFGTGAAFPQKYQDALFAFDWTFGTIYAVHLKPDGATYKAEVEEFISGQALPLTDGVIASDGALYFVTGGRSISSKVYRIVYVGGELTQPSTNVVNDSKIMKTRRLLEELHEPIGISAVTTAWEYISSEDDFLRHAARLALEHQDVAHWRDKALSETQPRAAIAALVALARHGNIQDRSPAISRLLSLSQSKLIDDEHIDLLRAYALVFMRLGPPSDEESSRIIKSLSKRLPSENIFLNREISRILAYLGSEKTHARLLDMLEAPSIKSQKIFTDIDPNLLSRNADFGDKIKAIMGNPGQVEKVHYAYLLHTKTCDWTFDQKEKYLRWIQNALEAEGGESYKGYLRKMRAIVLECTPKEIHVRFQHLMADDGTETDYLADLPETEGPGEDWTVEQISKLYTSDRSLRNYSRGKDMYKAGLCLACHSIAGKGGGVGPSLDGVSARFDVDYMLRSILHPDDSVSNQYSNTNIHTKTGEEITGRILSENDRIITVSTNPFDLSSVEVIDKSEIKSQEESNISPMPPGLIYGMNSEEILDLLAYIYASGNPNDSRFKESSQEIADQ